MRASASTTFCWAVVLVLLGSIAVANSTSVQILAHREECFTENVNAGTDLGIVFQVTAGGFLDIDVRISGPDGSEVYAGRRESEGKYYFVAHTTGLYSFCFSNRMSTLTPKTVSFSIKVGKKTEDAPKPSKEALSLVDGMYNAA
jgi:p24 family protein beta-1